MSLKSKLSGVRAEAEECFFAASAYMDRDSAEKIAITMCKIILEKEIKIHKEQIDTCNHLISHVNKKYSTMFDEPFVNGSVTAYEGRIKTHNKEIKTLTEKMELVDFL